MLFASSAAWAASADGKWSGSFSTPQGELQINFDLKSDGSKLTGKMTITGLNPTDIKDGKVDGDKLSFGAEIEFGANVIPLSVNGEVAGDDLKLNVEAMGQSNSMTLKREK